MSTVVAEAAAAMAAAAQTLAAHGGGVPMAGAEVAAQVMQNPTAMQGAVTHICDGSVYVSSSPAELPLATASVVYDGGAPEMPNYDLVDDQVRAQPLAHEGGDLGGEA